MIHTKSLIRRLDCVPWLLAACFMLGSAGETHAQSGAALLEVAPGATIDGTTGAVTARTDTVMLELNKRDVYEYDFTKDSPVASVVIEVTATRLNKATGAKMKDADYTGPPMLVALSVHSGEGSAVQVDVDAGTGADDHKLAGYAG